MQTNTKRSHRHLVVLPLTLVMVGLSFAQPYFDKLPDVLTKASSRLVSGQEEKFSFASGVYGVLYSGVIAEGESALRLDYGSAVLATESAAKVFVGETLLTMLNGQAYISVDEERLTVAAITSPVYIESGQQRMVVPAGMQWTMERQPGLTPLADGFAAWMAARTPRMLPSNFTERKLQDLAYVTASHIQLPEPQEQLPDTLDTALLLPISEENVRSDYTEQLLGAVRFAVESGEVAKLQELLAQDVVHSAVQSPRGQRVLAALLTQAPSVTPLRMQLVQTLSEDEAFWGVVLHHPEYRELAWSTFGPEASVESQLVRVFLLPYGALTSERFSSFVFERHVAAVGGIVEKVGNAAAFIENMLQAHVPLVQKLDALGYPRRAMALRDTLLALIKAQVLPTPGMEEAATTLRTFQNVDVSELPLPEPSSPLQAEVTETAAEPAVELTPDQVEATAYQMLSEAGALFSVQTAIAPFKTNAARVTDILFASSHEDRTVSFTLDVVAKTVSDIEVNGESNFPYTPTFEGFVTWISQ